MSWIDAVINWGYRVTDHAGAILTVLAHPASFFLLLLFGFHHALIHLCENSDREKRNRIAGQFGGIVLLAFLGLYGYYASIYRG